MLLTTPKLFEDDPNDLSYTVMIIFFFMYPICGILLGIYVECKAKKLWRAFLKTIVSIDPTGTVPVFPRPLFQQKSGPCEENEKPSFRNSVFSWFYYYENCHFSFKNLRVQQKKNRGKTGTVPFGSMETFGIHF